MNGGTLLVNSPGSLAAGSAVTVGASGTLGGDGIVSGAVSVAAFGTLLWEEGASLTVSGNLDISTLNLAVPAGFLTWGVWVIAQYGSLTGTAFSSVAVPPHFTVVYDMANKILLKSSLGTLISVL